jgi:hypothetical protein
VSERAGVWAGTACGVAVGFAAWALIVRLDIPFHYGTSDADSDLVRRAAMDAGWLWLVCTLVGTVAGAVVGAALSSSDVFGRRAPIASCALYLLAARGAWGQHGTLRGGADTFSTSAAAVLLALVVVVGALLALRAREDRADPQVLAIHLCLAFTAAHLAVQLPYYLAVLPRLGAGITTLSLVVY